MVTNLVHITLKNRSFFAGRQVGRGVAIEFKAVRLAAMSDVGVMLQHLLGHVAGNRHDGLV